MLKRASLAASRKKRYWQILKRLYGGTDEAVKNISKTRDSGVYHGTRASNVPGIQKSGLTPGEFREFGTGVFFGSKNTAGKYGAPKLLNRRGSNTNVWGVDLHNPSSVRNFLEDNPSHKFDKGALIRLKKPSEISDKNINYPNPQNVKVFGLKKGEGLHSVEDNYMRIMNSKAPKRLKKIYTRNLSSLNVQDLESEYTKILNKSPLYSSKEVKTLKKLPASIQDIAHEKVQSLVVSRGVPKTTQQYNNLVYYGKDTKGKSHLEKLSPGRKELFSETPIPPELLKIV